MATQVRIFIDGDVGVDLYFDGVNDGSVVEYNPRVPESTMTSVQRSTEDGLARPSIRYRDVDGEMLSLYIDDTFANMQDTIRTLNRAFLQARRVQFEGDFSPEEPVYIMVKLDGESDWWRSELINVNGALFEDGALDYYLGQEKVVFDFELTRRWYWEMHTQQSISLTNPAASGTTIEVYNCGDGYSSARYDYVDITAAQLDGDLPAPIKVILRNTYNNATRNDNIWVHMSTKRDYLPAHIIEGEDAVAGSGTQEPGTIDYSLYSGGYYWLNAWSSSADRLIGRWDIPNTTLIAAKGRYFQPLLRFADTPTVNTWLWITLTIESGATTIWTGPKFLVESWITDYALMGAIRIPPHAIGIDADYYALELNLYGQNAGGSATIKLDYIKLVSLDAWKFLEDLGHGQNYQWYTVLDEPSSLWYLDSGSTLGRLPNYRPVPIGRSLFVVPPADTYLHRHRLYFTWKPDNVQRTMDVTCYYRPRRLTI